MVPVIGLIQVGEQAMADRYTYIPLMGPTIALVWLVAELFAGLAECGVRSTVSKLFPAFIAVALLALCCLLTHRQIQYWRDTVTLFSHAAAVTANNSTAEFFVGLGLEKQGEPARAMVHYRAALAINPYEFQAHYNLAQLLRKSGEWQAAAEHYAAVLRMRPNDGKARLNLANALPHLGRAKEAVLLYGEVLQTDPDSIEAANNLAWLLATTTEAELRDGPRAVQLARHACELTQFKMTTLVGTLAAAYAEAGGFAEAVATVEKACALAAEANEQALLKKNQELLALYREGKPYRESVAQPQ
jgi:tetratricopeptide (TPR) repeat protein